MMEELPEGVGQLRALEHLDANACQILWMLPRSFSGLTALRTLDLHATDVDSLPEDISSLGALTLLDAGCCEMFASLPGGIGGLTSLVTLDLHQCVNPNPRTL